MHVCMLAAENDRIPGGKVGGIGDVIRDLPAALAAEGASVSVIVPAYGRFHERADAKLLGAFSVPFASSLERVEIHVLTSLSTDGVIQYVLHHPYFATGGPGVIYCDDPPGRPFASDATKFALYCMAALCAIRDGHLVNDKSGASAAVDVIHLHDWHCAFAAVLLAFDRSFASLAASRTVFGIHNLALQGIRPLTDDPSSLDAWYPGLEYQSERIVDPRWSDCINPMAAAVRLADRVHTVSPTYAREIIRPDDPARGFHGGEGLESDLAKIHGMGKLVGIVNGIDYPADAARKSDGHSAAPATAPAAARAGRSAGERGDKSADKSAGKSRSGKPDPVVTAADPGGADGTASWKTVAAALADGLLAALGKDEALPTADYLAHQRLLRWQAMPRPRHVLTSVGRLTGQKVALLLHRDKEGREVLDTLLDRLAGRGSLILLGTGDAELQKSCQRLAARHANFCFIRRFSLSLSEILFEQGDVFLMPSSFEPCGISQMLAMQAGQPPLVHAVGGLADTVDDGVDGFAFSGNSIDAQATAFLQRLDEVLTLRESEPERWDAIVDAAAARRFLWRESAKRYISELYT